MQTYELQLAGKLMVRADERDPKDKRGSGPKPSVARVFNGVGPADQLVLIRWDGAGNACNGYGYTFAAIKKDGTFSLSEDIPYCGGPEPMIAAAGGKVTFTVPEHAPNRGSGKVPATTWVYENGTVTKTP